MTNSGPMRPGRFSAGGAAGRPGGLANGAPTGPAAATGGVEGDRATGDGGGGSSAVVGPGGADSDVCEAFGFSLNLVAPAGLPSSADGAGGGVATSGGAGGMEPAGASDGVEAAAVFSGSAGVMAIRGFNLTFSGASEPGVGSGGGAGSGGGPAGVSERGFNFRRGSGWEEDSSLMQAEF